MRLASYCAQGRAGYGIVVENGIVDLTGRIDGAISLRELLVAGVEKAAPFAHEPITYSIDSVQWLPVIPDPGQILCAGLNYSAHAAEVGRPVGEYPTIFVRVAQSQTGHGQPIVRPRASEQLDYEAELAVVIGKAGRHIAASQAFGHVGGYSLYNDASLRDWQRHSAQYTPGKNFPATGAFGPWLVTTDEIADPSTLEIACRVNGETVQHAPLTQLIFPIPDVIAYLSTFTELRPGDVIVTGTPAGIGAMRTPPLWLKPGDTVDVEIPGIGTLSNPVAQEI